MKSLSCKQMGMEDNFVVTGETNAEVKKKMNEHAMKSHRDKMMGMTNDQKKEMEQMMDDMLAKQK